MILQRKSRLIAAAGRERAPPRPPRLRRRRDVRGFGSAATDASEARRGAGSEGSWFAVLMDGGTRLLEVPQER